MLINYFLIFITAQWWLRITIEKRQQHRKKQAACKHTNTFVFNNSLSNAHIFFHMRLNYNLKLLY